MWSPIDRWTPDVGGPPAAQSTAVAAPPATASVVQAAAMPTGVAPTAVTGGRSDADECLRTSPRLKLPPMFHMDSGSSFESYEPGDGLLQHQLLKHQQKSDETETTTTSAQSSETSPPLATVTQHLHHQNHHHHHHPRQQQQQQQRSAMRDERRLWLVLQDRKSRSFDSSFEDRRSQPVGGGGAPAQYSVAEHDSGPGLSGVRDEQENACRTRRRRLRQTQRKSRSLDVYEPGTHDYENVSSKIIVPRLRQSARVTDELAELPQRFGRGTDTLSFGQEQRAAVSARQSTCIASSSSYQQHVDEIDNTSTQPPVSRRSPRRSLAADAAEDHSRRPSPPLQQQVPGDRRPSPLHLAAPEPSRRSPRDSVSPTLTGRPSSGRSVTLQAPISPRDAAAIAAGVDRRITFATQKSFSYDVPSVEPPPQLSYRKQSEPIVNSSGAWQRQRQSVSGGGGVGRLLPRLPISGTQLEQHVNQLMKFCGSAGLNQSVDATNTTQQLKADFVTELKELRRQISPSRKTIETPTAATHATVAAGVRRSPAGHEPSTALEPQSSGRRRTFAGQKSLSYEVNRFVQYQQGDSSSGERLRDYLDENEIKEFEIEGVDGTGVSVWVPPPTLSSRGEELQATRSGGLEPPGRRASRVGGQRRAHFAEQRSFSCEAASAASRSRDQRAAPGPNDAATRRYARESAVRLVRQSKTEAPDAVEMTSTAAVDSRWRDRASAPDSAAVGPVYRSRHHQTSAGIDEVLEHISGRSSGLEHVDSVDQRDTEVAATSGRRYTTGHIGQHQAAVDSRSSADSKRYRTFGDGSYPIEHGRGMLTETAEMVSGIQRKTSPRHAGNVEHERTRIPTSRAVVSTCHGRRATDQLDRDRVGTEAEMMSAGHSQKAIDDGHRSRATKPTKPLNELIPSDSSSLTYAASPTVHTDEKHALPATGRLRSSPRTEAEVVTQSVSWSRTAAVEPRRGTHKEGHHDYDDDDDGELVSDGIVTWRRKLPDLGELGRASTLSNHQHYHHPVRHPGKQQVLADTRMGEWTSRSSGGGRRERRDAFAQQKSFSYEAGCVGRRLPATPDDLARAHRGGGGDPHGGTGSASSSVRAVDRRRRMLMEVKKSYSLDDQIAPSHLVASEPPAYETELLLPPARGPAHDRLQIGRDGAVRGREQELVTGERSPSAHRKQQMLRTMRAMQHDNAETPPPPEPPPAAPVRTDSPATMHTSSTSESFTTTVQIVHPKPADPPPRVPPPTSRVDRLPIARILGKLKFERRSMTAGTGKR